MALKYIKDAPLNLFENRSNLEKFKVSTPAILRKLRADKEKPKINKVLFFDPQSKSIIRMPIPNNININISNKNKYNEIIKDMNNLKNKIEQAKKKKLQKKQKQKEIRKLKKNVKHKNAPSANRVSRKSVMKKKTTKI